MRQGKLKEDSRTDMKPINTIIDRTPVQLRVHFFYPHKFSSRRRRVEAVVKAFVPAYIGPPDVMPDDIHEGWTLSRQYGGAAVCNLSEGDRFDKEAGRKLALDRALLENFPRAVRRQVWDAYWGRK